MKPLFASALFFAVITQGFGASVEKKAPAPAKTAAAKTAPGKGAQAKSGPIRTVRDLPGFPQNTLKRIVSPKFYKSLLISPVEGYVVVRGHLSGGRFHGGQVTHSELGGAYDDMALALANKFTISHVGHMDYQMAALAVHQYLVIYKIADGLMALSFPVLAEAGRDQDDYYGSAFLAVKKDGKWTEIKGPEIRRR